jgi:hypothetical protein
MRVGIQSVLGAGLMACVLLLPLASASECIWGDCENGRGTRRDSSGVYQSGIWKDRQLIEELPRTRDDLRQEQKRRGCVQGDCISGKGTRVYPDGSSYTGQFKDGKREGQGTLSWPDGVYYTGQWRADKKHGYGTQAYTDSEYGGVWRDNSRTAQGKLTWKNGNTYVGEYLGDQRHGFGVMSWSNGDRYEGEFRSHEIHGVGTKTFADGRVREGRWVNGRYRGRLWSRGRAPAGEAAEPQESLRGGCVSGDCANGRGAYAYADGSMYVGEFRRSQPHGRGSLTAPDGSVRVGAWERGRRISRRATTLPARISDIAGSGCTAGDCRNGRGSYRWSNGSSYTGGFRKFKQHGQGTLVYANGASYVGEWRDGRRHGYGSYTEPDGRQRVGLWKNSRYAGPLERQALAAALTGGGLGWPDLSQPAPAIGGGDRDAAVIVGLQDYSLIADIEGAADNATAWYEYLASTRGVPPERISLLIDEDATLEEMRRATRAGARQVREGGTLWFVFIGHGAPATDGKDGLLVGFDAQQKARSIEARSFQRGDLLALLESSPASSIQVYLDACFSGRSGGGDPLVEGLQPLVVTELEASSDTRTTVLTAARDDEYAGPLPGSRRPAFSYLALGGLRGWADDSGDGLVTASELQSYVEKAIRMLVRDRKQRPVLIGSPDAELVRSSRETGPDLSQVVLGLSRSRH